MAIAASFPSIKPSLSLDFANVGALDPRVTFTRSTTGTYYDGVTTAKAEENLLLRSQDYSTTWTVSNLTPVTGKTAPDSTSTATEFTANIGIFQFQLNQALTLATATTFSIFVKAGTHPYVQLRYTGDATSFVNFDVTAGAGAVGTSGGTATGSIVDVGNGWYRCIAVNTSTAVTGYYVNLVPSSSSARAASLTALGTETVELWGAQVEARSQATAYTPTTTQPITNYIPVLQTAAAGQARFDHNPTTGEALGLLIEEQRTNLLTYSEQFDTVWTNTRSSEAANVVIAPDGTLTADKLIANTDNNSHFVVQGLALSAITYTFSVYAKAAEYSGVRLQWTEGTNAGAQFDLLNGTVSLAQTGVTAAITPVGDGWYRCVMTKTNASAGSNPQISVGFDGTTFSYIGNNANGIYIWGAQLEAGAFPTSYIPTTSAQVTRNADAASMTGADFSSWFNNGEGTLYGEAKAFFIPVSESFGVATAKTGNTNAIGIGISPVVGPSSNIVRTNDAPQATFTAAMTNNVYHKVSMSYTTNDFIFSVDGGAAQVDTTGILPVVDSLFIGQNRVGSVAGAEHIRKIAYYPQALTAANLQALTA